MSSKFFLTAAIAVLTVSSVSNATVRIVPANNYGQVKDVQGPIDLVSQLAGFVGDHLDNFSTNVFEGEVMGGDDDLLFQMNKTTGNAEVYQCHSIKFCVRDLQNSGPISLDAAVDKCVEEDSSWNQCNEIFEAPKSVMCDKFVDAYRFITVRDFIVENVIGTVIISPIPFFTKGVGLVANTVAGLVEDEQTIMQVIDASCGSQSLDQATGVPNDDGKVLNTGHKTMSGKIVIEEEHDNVKTALEAFKSTIGAETNSLMSHGNVHRRATFQYKNLSNNYLPVSFGPIRSNYCSLENDSQRTYTALNLDGDRIKVPCLVRN